MKELALALLGFIFALLFFYIQEYVKERRERKIFIKNLKREIEYNLVLIDEWIKDVKHNTYLSTWAKPIHTFTPSYGLFRQFFITKSFENGRIYELFDNEKIRIVIGSLTYFSKDNLAHIRNYINKYKNIEVADEDGTPGSEYVKQALQDHLKILNDKKEKLESLLPKITI